MAEAVWPGGSFIPIMLVVAVVGIGVIMTISVRGKIARRDADRPSPREMIDRLKRDAAGRGWTSAAPATSEPAGRSDAELVDVAKRLAAQLDNKARRLEVLIEQADRRLDALAQATAARPAASPGKPPPPPPAAAPSPDPLTQAVYERADAGQSAVDIARELDEQVGKVELILALRG